MLAERLVSRNSSISTERATIFDSLTTALRVFHKRLNLQRFFMSLSVIFRYIAQDELIIGSQSSTPRGAIFHTEDEARSDSIYRF